MNFDDRRARTTDIKGSRRKNCANGGITISRSISERKTKLFSAGNLRTRQEAQRHLGKGAGRMHCAPPRCDNREMGAHRSLRSLRDYYRCVSVAVAHSHCMYIAVGGTVGGGGPAGPPCCQLCAYVPLAHMQTLGRLTRPLLNLAIFCPYATLWGKAINLDYVIASGHPTLDVKSCRYVLRHLKKCSVSEKMEGFARSLFAHRKRT